MRTQISAILLNISHMAYIIMENIVESDYNRSIVEICLNFCYWNAHALMSIEVAS